MLFKKGLAQVFPSEFCKIFKNTFSYKTLPVAIAKVAWKTLDTTLIPREIFLGDAFMILPLIINKTKFF